MDISPTTGTSSGAPAESPGGVASGDMATADANSAVAAARRVRAGLHNALIQLEAAVAAPVPGRVPLWSGNVHEALIMLRAAFERHLAITEGGGGLIDQIMSSSPHLAHAVDEIRSEHREIRGQIDDTAEQTRMMDPVEVAADDVRDHVMKLFDALVRHRQKGSDLVYDAFTIDIGGSE